MTRGDYTTGFTPLPADLLDDQDFRYLGLPFGRVKTRFWSVPVTTPGSEANATNVQRHQNRPD